MFMSVQLFITWAGSVLEVSMRRDTPQVTQLIQGRQGVRLIWCTKANTNMIYARLYEKLVSVTEDCRTMDLKSFLYMIGFNIKSDLI